LFADDAPEKQALTKAFFQKRYRHQFELFISGVVISEIEKAPLPKRNLLFAVIEGVDVLEMNQEAENLALAYLKSGALPRTSIDDARHVALATIHNLDAVISWNFKHLVNLRRIKMVHLVNEQMGYKHIEIISPQEVIDNL
jgi:predicted nucleic acid-binding protein